MVDLKRWRTNGRPSPRRLNTIVHAAALLALVSSPCASMLLAQRPAADGARDSAFLLATNDPSRTPSGFLGNGHVGVVIPPLGIGASTSLIAGLYEHGANDVPRIAAAPAWNAIDVFDGDRWLGAARPNGTALRAYAQSIDMRTGTASTGYDWIDGDRRTSVRVQMFLSRADPHLAAVKLVLVPHTTGPMRVRFALANWPAPERLPLDTLARAKREWGPRELWYPGHMNVRSRSASRAAAGARLAMTAAPDGRTSLLAERAAISWAHNLRRAFTRAFASGDTALVELSFEAAAGETYTFSELVSIVSSRESPNAAALAATTAATAQSLGYDALAALNAAAWRRRWETDIEIDGDAELQREVRSMLFYLMCSADSGTTLAIPPMGLSSGGYYGHVFWDSDTWMFPALVLTHPDIARSLVDFRARTVAAAKSNARANGYRGAMYPWEADELGHETTPHFAAQNAHMEIHVNGDVAMAQWQYYLATGDSAWLARTGYPVLRATANFWVSRATYDSARGRYDIDSVVSVAEGLVGVNDDAYTNAVARKNLEAATAASTRLGVPPDPRWSDVAARLHMPFDTATQSYRTYEDAPDSSTANITPLLSYPLGVPMTDHAKRTHLERSVRNIADEAAGAMMGVTLLSVNAAELGDRALVDSLLPYSYRSHTHGPFLMLSETPTNGAVNFLTGAGGFLQQVIFGYTGLRLGDGGLEPKFAPLLPSHISRLVLRGLHLRGKRYDVIVDTAGRRIVPHVDRAAR